jgi:UDP-N-acetylmuramate dehydrogenase
MLCADLCSAQLHAELSLLEIIDNADLSTRTSLRLHSRVDRLIRVHHPAELADAKLALHGPFRGLLGEGSNSVFGAHIRGTLLQIAWRGIEHLERHQVRAQAGEPWDELVQWSLAQNLQGLENLSMIPGSVGAAPIQNIGAYGVELAQRFVSLEAIHWESMARKRFAPEDCLFAYRSSIFKQPSHQSWIICHIDVRLNPLDAGEPDTSLDYRYPDLQRRFHRRPPDSALAIAAAIRDIRSSKLPDPNIEPNAGSFFHNPRLSNETALSLKARFPELPIFPDGEHHHKLSAAWMIEHCGMKGHRQGDVGVSAKHALVLVNHGQATGEVLMAFARQIIDLVKERFGLQLSIEPRVLLA